MLNRLTKWKTKAVAVFVTFLVAFSFVLMPMTAKAEALYGWTNHSGAASQSNGLASFILSKSEQGAAGGQNVALDELKKLGNDENHAYDYSYGNKTVIDNDKGESEVGNHISRTIATLFDYGYLSPHDSSANVMSDDGTIAMMPTLVGLQLYKAAGGVVSALNDGIAAINVVNIFGLEDNSNKGLGNVTNVGGESVNMHPNGIIGDMIKGLLTDNGIDFTFIKAVMAVAFLIIVAIFVLVTMRATKNYKQGNSWEGSKHWGMRALTMAFATPLTILFTALLIEMTSGMIDISTNNLDSFTDGTIIDSLEFAGDTNLNLGYVGSGFAAGGYAEANDNYRPTIQNIQSMNKQLAVISKGAEKDHKSAADKLTGYIQGNESFTVDDYLSWISANKGGIAAQYLNGVDAGKTGDETMIQDVSGGYGKNIWNLDITPRPIKDVYAFSANTSDTNYAGEKDGDKKLANRKDGNSIRKASEKAHDYTTLQIGGFSGNQFVYISEPTDKLGKVERVSLSDPQTYLYASNAAKSGSPEKTNTNNYRRSNHVTDNSMNVQPWDGKSYNVNEIKADDKNTSFIANNVARSYINANAGVTTSPNGTPSFSTQSTVFLLQSKYGDSTLKYKAASTAGTRASESANVGANSYKYSRYVIPHHDGEDLVAKQATLNLTWLSAGWAAALGLLALITGPFLGSLFKAYKGWGKAQFTGNIFGLFDYFLFMFAVFGSLFMFALSTQFGVMVVSIFSGIIDIVNKNGTGAARGVQQSLSKLPLPFGIGEGLGNVAGGIISIMLMIVLSLIIVAILTYPLITLDIGGERKKCNVVETMVTLPMALAATASTALSRYESMLYGKSSSSSGGTGMSGFGKSGRGLAGKAAGFAGKAALGLGGIGLAGAALAHGAGGSALGAAKEAYKHGGGAKDIAKNAIKGGIGGAQDVANKVLPTIGKETKNAIKGFNANGLGSVAPAVMHSLGGVKDSMLTAQEKMLKNDVDKDNGDTGNGLPNTSGIATQEGISADGANGALNGEGTPVDSLIGNQDSNAVDAASKAIDPIDNMANAQCGEFIDENGNLTYSENQPTSNAPAYAPATKPEKVDDGLQKYRDRIEAKKMLKEQNVSKAHRFVSFIAPNLTAKVHSKAIAANEHINRMAMEAEMKDRMLAKNKGQRLSREQKMELKAKRKQLRVQTRKTIKQKSNASSSEDMRYLRKAVREGRWNSEYSGKRGTDFMK